MEESVKIKIAIDAIKTNNLPLLKLVIDFETQLQALAGIHFRTIEKLEPKEQQKHREVEILKAQLTTIGKYAVGVLGLSELNQELVQIPFVAKIGFTAAFTERKLTAHTVLVGGVRQALTPQHLETLRIEFEHKVQMELSHFQLPRLTSNTDIREVLNKLKERYQAAETILEQFVGQKTSAAMAMQDTQQKLAQERQETALIYVQNSGGMNEDANSSQEAIESLLKMNLSLDAIKNESQFRRP